MKVTLKNIKATSRELLRILDSERVNSIEDLARAVGKNCRTNLWVEDFVSFDNRPSNEGTKAYTVSYTRPGTGIPLELKINPHQDYSRVMSRTLGINFLMCSGS